MKNVFLILISVLCLPGWQQVNAQTEKGVNINGVVWATRNVDAPGKFTLKPENPGKFYQWNRNIPWTTVGKNITGWDNSRPDGTVWNEANDPSPAGWRVPSLAEIEKLLDENKVKTEWTTLNGRKGRKFTDKVNGNSIFIPAANNRDSEDGHLVYGPPFGGLGEMGYYWGRAEGGYITEKPEENIKYAQSWWFSENYTTTGALLRMNGFCIRPVATNVPHTTSANTQGTSLTYYRVTDKVNYTKIDFSKLDIKKDGEYYSVLLPFTVTKPIPAGELFWLTIYDPKGNDFSAWGIHNAADKFICRSFRWYTVGQEAYVLQSQRDLTEQVVQGNYTLILHFKEKPTTNGVQVSVAYSTQKVFDEYAELLSQKEINSILPSSSTSDQWFDKGNEYYSKPQYRLASICFLQADKLQPEDFSTNYNLGLCYYNLREYKSAVKYFEKSLRLSGVDQEDKDDIYSNLGDSYYSMKDYQKAKENYKRISNKTPHDYFWLGCSQYGLEDYSNEARFAFREIEKDSELYSDAQHYFGLSLWNEGEKLIPTDKNLGFFKKGNALVEFIARAADLGSQSAQEWLAKRDQSTKLVGTKWLEVKKITEGNRVKEVVDYSKAPVEFKSNGKVLWNNEEFMYLFDGKTGCVKGTKQSFFIENNEMKIFGTRASNVTKYIKAGSN